MKEGNEMIGNECRQEVKEQENSECKFKLYIQCKCNYASIQINSIQFNSKIHESFHSSSTCSKGRKGVFVC
jgi:hypothetical protein